MICPSKLCRCEIPDDSFYCDQCGIKILKCENCGAVGISNFCGKCGKHMIFMGDLVSEEKPETKTPVVESKLEEKPKPIEEPQSVVEPQHMAEPQHVVEEKPVVESFEEPVSTFGESSSEPMGTQIIQLTPDPVLELCGPDGITMKPASQDILGRVLGPFASVLGKIPVISSQHAKVMLKDGKWYIKDLNSTNKTYVNEKRLEPGVAVELANNDVVVLANVSFVVRIS